MYAVLRRLTNNNNLVRRNARSCAIIHDRLSTIRFLRDGRICFLAKSTNTLREKKVCSRHDFLTDSTNEDGKKESP